MGFFKRIFGPRENDQQRVQKQVNTLYEQCIEILNVELFRRLVGIVEQRYPQERAKPIAANAKLFCTAEGENDRSLKTSTPEERSIGRSLADEIMALDVPGLYGIKSENFVDVVTGLPDTLESIRRLALCFDQYAAILTKSRRRSSGASAALLVLTLEYAQIALFFGAQHGAQRSLILHKALQTSGS